MPQPPEPDPLEPRPVRPERAHLHLLALAAVSPMSLALAQRLTLYGIKSCHKMLEDLKHWGWLRPQGQALLITTAGRRALGEMVFAARAEVATK